MKYRKKPIIVEARQYTRMAMEAEKVATWCNGQQTDEGLIIKTLEGDMLANYGDWIVEGIEGEFHPVKNRIFLKTYEEIKND